MNKRWIKNKAFIGVMVIAVTMGSSTLYAHDYENHWAKAAIEQCMSQGIIKGYEDGGFRPKEMMTRAQLATVLMPLISEETPQISPELEDVSDTAWYQAAVYKISGLQIMNIADQKFRPSDQVTREEVAYAIANLYSISGTGTIPFADGHQVSEWARSQMSAFIEKGYIKGKSENILAPQDPITRAEVVVILSRVLSDQNQSEVTESKKTQTERINEALTTAKDTLVKQITVSVDKVNQEELNTYRVPGPLVVYVRNVEMVPLDAHSIEIKIHYTTWYQALKLYQEPKLYENKVTETSKQVLAKAKEVIKELGIEKETSAYVKEKAIHDYLIANGKYSEEINFDIAAPMHGAEGLLLNQDGICRSYAEGMQLFMEMLGVESKIMLGYSLLDYQKHVWNVIKLDDGKWYYVDATWDETIPEIPGKVNYDYFNVPESMIIKEHELEEWQVLEGANSMDYFPYKDCIAYTDQEVITIVKNYLEKGERKGIVYLYEWSNVNQVIELVKQAMREVKVQGEILVTKESKKLYSFSIK